MNFTPLDYNKTYHLTQKEMEQHDIRLDGTSPRYDDESLFSVIYKPPVEVYADGRAKKTEPTFSVTRINKSDSLPPVGKKVTKRVEEIAALLIDHEGHSLRAELEGYRFELGNRVKEINGKNYKDIVMIKE